MNVFVTGGAGRLGTVLIKTLVEHGHVVSAVDFQPPSEAPCKFSSVNLLNLEQLLKEFEINRNIDAVVHLARERFPYTESGFNLAAQRWEMPDVIGNAERFHRNIATTHNVLTCALRAGIPKIVCGSSLAVYGLYYPIRKAVPDYLPIDEDHPRRPQDPYGLTKLVGEQMCDAFCRKSDLQIASLRYSGIYADENRAVLVERRKNPNIRGTGALWSYIDVRDAATACRLAIEVTFQGHQTFNICAPTTIMDVATGELIQQYLPEIKEFRAGLARNACAYSTTKAQTLLGFVAKHLL